MKTKTQYRIRNWSAYNAALIARGSLTLWVDEEAVRAWRYTGPTQRGAQYLYAEAAISCMLTLRAADLTVALGALPRTTPLHLVIDSSGFKVYGEGEWKVRQHGWSKRRTWRKLHLGVDEATGEIVAAVASEAGVVDDEVLPELVAQVEGEIRQVSADRAYDKRHCYDALAERGTIGVIPPRRDAKIW